MRKEMVATDMGTKEMKAAVKAILANEGSSKSQKMKDLFDLGFEVKEITEMMQVRYNFVYNVVSNYCTMNGIKVETTEKTGKKDQIIALYLEGKSNKEIAIELKTNYNYVHNVLKKYKLENPVPVVAEVQEEVQEEAQAQ